MRAALMASAASAAFFGASPAFAQPEDALMAQSPATRLTVPLLYDGSYRGDVPVAIDGDRVAVWTSQLVTLIGPRLSSEMRDRIFAAATTPVAIDLDALNRLGIQASFNTETLELSVSIPLAAQGQQSVSGAALIDGDERDFLKSSNFSATATVLVSQRRVWQSPTEATGFKPVQVTADLAANIGGAKGVFLFSQHTYDGQTRSFQRGNSELVFDLADAAIRTTVGDVAGIPQGFQTSPLVGGISVQRAWNELQPLRNIRPSGQASFVLDRPSTIDVVVNGAVVRSMQLQPGRYDLNQLPFVNGLNEVELYVQDEQGRRLLTTFSQFYTARLLAKGLLDFSLTAGVLEDLSGTGSRYRGKEASISGWARYGVSSNLTLGANFQAGGHLVSGGVEGVVATGLGAFSAVASVSRATVDGVAGRGGHAVLVGYDGQFGDLGPFHQLRLNADWRLTSRNFAQLGQQQANTVRSQLQARATARFAAGINAGFSYLRSTGYDLNPDRQQFSAQLRKSWGRFDLSGSFDRISTTGQPRDHRVLLTASMRLGRSQDLRSSYDSRSQVARVDYTRFARDEVGTLGIRAGVERTPGTISATGQALYNSNDFRLALDHRVFRSNGGNAGRNGGTAQESRYTVSTQVAMAGGKIAYGRPVGSRFAIVSAHPTLKDAHLSLTDGATRKNPLAKARKGRPALVALGSPYLTSRIKVDVDRLPAGYDIGPGEYRMKPTPAAGYAITVGSDASRMIMGVALDAAGQPLAQMGGTLISLDDPNMAPVLVFTNRNGRFVVSGLKPGRYELRMGNDGAWRIPVVVPKDDETTIALGTLRLAPRKASR
ncbi:fimbria/pilus outer membrane usher protein [Novosphingobium sp. ERN07]|uniref:fimbria/pilus outer membrane usher protein n=1 Tax=Novosphingobium sp. ERN07 TaxID=2726187 RepID=UPI001456D1DB|nr:fimbria/pilus outer membrane usher protein [Novosphingobium sp. ERN07]